MATNLRKLDGWIDVREWPSLPCGVCGDSSLAIEGSLDCVASEQSRREQRQHPDAWEPDWIRGFFDGRLRCSNPSCDEIAVVSGDYRVNFGSGHVDQWAERYADFVMVRFIRPAPPIVEMPQGTPEGVVATIATASSQIWLDPGAAANRLRTAVEELLTALGIPRYEKAVSGRKRKRRMLDARIELARVRFPSAADQLMAVKWIGNEGSHSSDGLTATDVLDGCEHLAYALQLMLEDDANLVQRARAIAKRKGRPPKRRDSNS